MLDIEEALHKPPVELPVKPALIKVIHVPALDHYCSLWAARDRSNLLICVHVCPHTRWTDSGEPIAAGFYPVVWASLAK